MRNVRSSSWAITAVMVFFIAIMVRWPWQGGTRNIRSDVKGYHAYLRALFITHDLGHEPDDFEYLNKTPTGTLNKYFAGESVLLLPFFLAAHGVAHAFGYPTDGYSDPYQKCISIAALVYAFIGLLCLRALMTGLAIRDRTIAMLVMVLGLGTQLLQYTAMQPGWTHAYSFCAICALLLAVQRLEAANGVRSLIAAGVLFGLVVLIRPVNGLALLAVPVVHGDRTRMLITHMFARPLPLIAAIMACVGVLSIQPLLWHAQTGQWWQWSYKGEGFYWDDPKFLHVLFGIRRGLFVWTPVLIPVALSAVLLWKHDRVRSLFTLLYWLVTTYVISAWWIWYYGGGFGQRVYIDHYPVLLIPFALMLERAGTRMFRLSVLFLGIASLFHLAQFWQYHHDIIHHVSMDRTKYAYTFMRFGPPYRNVLGGNDQEAPYHPNGMTLVAQERCGFESPCAMWEGGYILERPGLARSGTRVCQLDSVNVFSATLKLPSATFAKGAMAHLELEFDRYEPVARSSFDALAVLSVERTDGTMDYYEPVRMNPLPGDIDGAWEHIRYKIPIPIFMNGQEVRFYIWNRGTGTFYLDDLQMRAYGVDPY